MLNQAILVGKVEEIIMDSEQKSIKLSITRNFRNDSSKEFDTDLINLVLSENLIESYKSYIKVGDTLAAKARLMVDNNELLVIAEKLSFISD